MVHVPPVSGMTTSGPVVNPTSSSTESDMARSSTTTAPTPKKASRQLQT